MFGMSDEIIEPSEQDWENSPDVVDLNDPDPFRRELEFWENYGFITGQQPPDTAP